MPNPSKYSRRYWLLIAIVLGGGGLLSWLLETRLHGLVVGLVEKYLGIYYPDLTGLVFTLALTLIPVYIGRNAAYIHEYELKYEDLVTRLQTRMVYLALGVVFMSGVCVLVYQLHENAPSASQEPVIVDLSGEISKFLFFRKVQLNGIAMSKHATFSKDLRETSSMQLRRYTPIRSKANRARPIQFVESLTSDSTQTHRLVKPAMQGYVSHRLLPAKIKASFVEDGLTMGGLVYVIEQEFVEVRPFLKWLGVAFLLFTLLILVRLLLAPLIHRKKLQRAWDHQKGYSKTKNVKDDVFPWGR